MHMKNAETRDRTGDLQIFSLTLSQLSYRGLVTDTKKITKLLLRLTTAKPRDRPRSRQSSQKGVGLAAVMAASSNEDAEFEPVPLQGHRLFSLVAGQVFTRRWPACQLPSNFQRALWPSG